MRETFLNALPRWFFLIVLLCFVLFYVFMLFGPNFPEPPPEPAQ
jgi:hypothetical protein